jgi:hypothetical protein
MYVDGERAPAVAWSHLRFNGTWFHLHLQALAPCHAPLALMAEASVERILNSSSSPSPSPPSSPPPPPPPLPLRRRRLAHHVGLHALAVRRALPLWSCFPDQGSQLSCSGMVLWYSDGKNANRDTKVWHGATENGP